ncbi:MAG TPA: AAA family ATPase, partial [Thermoleophilaceae bacterium]|nr:AAA family ATPase [Thermoleophilaceae bacterium]
MEAGVVTGRELPLLDRDRELAAVREILDRAAGGEGAAALVEGPAGIGKTRLLGAGVELAHRFTVARASGGELEREIAFGVARQLFERPLAELTAAERDQLLAG